MNKYALGTILGTALLGLAKSRLGSTAKKIKLFFDSAIDIRAYYRWEASFIVDEEVSEQQSSEQQSSEQQSSEQQSSSQEEFDRDEMLSNIESDLQCMIGDMDSELSELLPPMESDEIVPEYSLGVHIEAKTWRTEGYDVEIGFYLVRARDGIEKWVDKDKVEQEFMQVFETIATQGNAIVERIINDNFRIDGAELDYVTQDSDLEIGENSTRTYMYVIDENGNKRRVNRSPFLTSAHLPKIRKR
jgi:flagellar motor switch/type III secretory pathway protein FliN